MKSPADVNHSQGVRLLDMITQHTKEIAFVSRSNQGGNPSCGIECYRAIAVIDSNGKTRLWSRNRLPLEPKFPMVLDAVD